MRCWCSGQNTCACVWSNTVVDSGTAGMCNVRGMSGLWETEAGSCQLLCQDRAISFQAFIPLPLSLTPTHSLTRLTIISPTNFHLIFPLVHLHRCSSSVSHPCTSLLLADTPCALSNPPLLLISGLGLLKLFLSSTTKSKVAPCGVTSWLSPPLILLPSLICSQRKLVFFVFFFESIKKKTIKEGGLALRFSINRWWQCFSFCNAKAVGRSVCSSCLSCLSHIPNRVINWQRGY